MKYFLLIVHICFFTIVHAQIKDSAVVIVKDASLVKVEAESEFHGGTNAWIAFLSRNMEYPKKAVKHKIQGVVVVQFIVEKDGTVSNIEAISGPDELKEAAVELITKSPRWKPAWQNGKFVRSFKKQPIVYRLDPQ